MRDIPVREAEKLKAEGMAWRDVAQELAWATGRKFSFDGVQNAVYARRRKTLRLPNSLGLDAGTTRDAAILALWNLGFDTFDIAKKIGLHEAQVANLLAHLRGENQGRGEMFGRVSDMESA